MPSISVQEAVKNAKKSLLELYQDDSPKALALEEIEFVDDSARPLWSVTLGFHRLRSVTTVDTAGNNSLANMFGRAATEVEHRIYKTVFIDANTGDFVKMDMRQVQ